MANQFEQVGKECYNCDFCGIFVWKYPSQIQNRVFCSSDCLNKWQSVDRKYNANTEICDTCEIEFKRKPSHVHEHTFCTAECYYKWESKDNPQYFYSTSSWQNKRVEILEKYDYTCQECNSEDRLEVHHKTPMSEGGSKLDNSNLTVLCKQCHIEEHR